MTSPPGRFPLSPLLTAALLLSLLLFLFGLSLRPTAWGGPRGAGPFEEESLPSAGRWARDARLAIETVATWRSPNQPLAAMAEALAGYHALLAAARYAILWLLLRRMVGSDLLAAGLVVASAVPLAFGAPRQTDADVGLLLFVSLMAATTPTRVPWWLAILGLPALFAFWANAHASALVGLAWLGVVATGRCVEALRDWESGARPTAGRLLIAVALCAAAICANPDGPRLYVDAVAAVKNPNVWALPAWQPIDFTHQRGMPWAYFATLSVLFLMQLFGVRILSLTAMLILLTFGFWPLLQQRGLAYWWLIVPWLLAPLLARGWPIPSLTCDWPRWLKPLLIVAGVLAILSTPAARWLIAGQPRELERIVSADTPARLAQELTANAETEGNYLTDLRATLRAGYPNGQYRGAILSGVDQGDFLAWVLDGDNNQPVMTYTRPEALGRDHWAECRKALDGSDDWWEILGRHQVNLVAIDPTVHGRLADRLHKDEEWRIVQEGGRLLVAVRREPKLPVELMGP